jgi:predicted CoA-substrate-specific enzyme activase
MMDITALGIDAGSTTIKVVGVDTSGRIVIHLIEDTAPLIEEQASRLLDGASSKFGYPNHLPILATGYGRRLVNGASKTMTEITCHARGVYQEFKHGGTLIDIGGQDSKVIRISNNGKVTDFAMNDKCAAGTGRFLENTANRLSIPVEHIAKEASTSSGEVAISSTCTVFAESEIISLLAHGTPIAEILRGLHRALVDRVIALVHTVGFESPLMLSGGVVQNPLIEDMISQELNFEALLPEHPQLVGAYGAALLANSKDWLA